MYTTMCTAKNHWSAFRPLVDITLSTWGSLGIFLGILFFFLPYIIEVLNLWISGQVPSCAPEGCYRWSRWWGSPNHKYGSGPRQLQGWSAKWAIGEALPYSQLLGWLTHTCLMQLVLHLFWSQGLLSFLPQALIGRREEGNSPVLMLSQDKWVMGTALSWL